MRQEREFVKSWKESEESRMNRNKVRGVGCQTDSVTILEGLRRGGMEEEEGKCGRVAGMDLEMLMTARRWRGHEHNITTKTTTTTQHANFLRLQICAMHDTSARVHTSLESIDIHLNQEFEMFTFHSRGAGQPMTEQGS
jgi:hypothetical protein